MSSGIHFSSDGFMQFGDGEPIPASDIKMAFEHEPAPDSGPLPRLGDFQVTVPMPFEAAPGILRLVGEDSLADGIDIAIHPDLAELNVQMDGYYGDATDSPQ